MKNYTKSYTTLILLCVIVVMSGCQSLVPATSPPQLAQTPGAPLVITDDEIDAGWFSLDYPDGWRVVTNVAIEPVRLVLVSPDDEVIVTVQDTTGIVFSMATPQPGIHYRMAMLRDDDRYLSIYGEIDDIMADRLDTAFDFVESSVRFP